MKFIQQNKYRARTQPQLKYYVRARASGAAGEETRQCETDKQAIKRTTANDEPPGECARDIAQQVF